jgi:hypothetical protein
MFARNWQQQKARALRTTVVVELVVGPKPGPDLSYEDKVAALTDAATRAKAAFEKVIEHARKRDPDLKVAWLEGIFPIVEVTALPEIIESLSSSPLVSSVSPTPRIRLSR